MFTINKDLLIILSGIVLLFLILLVILIPSTTSRINPNSAKLSQAQLLESLNKQEYSRKKSISVGGKKEYDIFEDSYQINDEEYLYDTLIWEEQHSIQKYDFEDKTILIIPEIKFDTEDWKLFKTALIMTQKNVEIHAGLLKWTREHEIFKKYSLFESESEKPLYIHAYHSGCFLAYGLYCMLENIKNIKLYGCPNFFSTSEEMDDIIIYISLNDPWLKFSFSLDTENTYMLGGNLYVATNENDYKNVYKFQKLQ